MVEQVISIKYHNVVVAVLSYNLEKMLGNIEFTPKYYDLGLDLAPLIMPNSEKMIFNFPEISKPTFKGLPGMIADSLPDKFGTAILNQWWAAQGRIEPITPIERLSFTGSRGMGALEYEPVNSAYSQLSVDSVDISELRELAQQVVDNRNELGVSIKKHQSDPDAMKSLLIVGTSAGGARPKAVLAFNDGFTHALSGQVEVPKGYKHYLMKFDGVVESNSNEETFGDPQGYGAMEYVYHKMAIKSGIDMEDCFLLPEGPRRHFLTKRFDRVGGKKIHTQTLTAIAHVDYNTPGSFSYEELFNVARRLKLPVHDAKQLFSRMAFNIISKNNDDHSKNFSFQYVDNKWRVTPAYDVAYCYKENNLWVGQHWMSANGKRKEHSIEDLIAVGRNVTSLPHSFFKETVEKTIDSLSDWVVLAKEFDVPKNLIDEINKGIDFKQFTNKIFHVAEIGSSNIEMKEIEAAVKSLENLGSDFQDENNMELDLNNDEGDMNF